VMLYLGKARDQFLRAKTLLDGIVENGGGR
jgi:hypothetical protein